MNLTARKDYFDTTLVQESPVVQTSKESIVYNLDVTNRGSSPANESVTVLNTTTGEDVTTEVTSGTTEVVGNVISTPLIQNLKANNIYELIITYEFSTETRMSNCVIRVTE